jgi:flagellar basal-body rod modification protein FlgD
MMHVDGLGLASAAESIAKVPEKVEMGKAAFLKLLVAQLENQDPTDPMDNGAFVAQLAQFSSLEGITNLGISMDGMAANMSSLQNLNTAGLIGREVLTEGNGLEYAGEGDNVVFGYGLDESAASVTVGVYDAAGRLVRHLDLGAVGYGDHVITWDGIDDSGNLVAPGSYTFDVQAANESRDEVGTVLYTSGTVSAISMEDGTASLVVGGRLITQDKIKEIY